MSSSSITPLSVHFLGQYLTEFSVELHGIMEFTEKIHLVGRIFFLYPRPTKLEGGILDSPCPSVCSSVRLSVDDMVSGA